MSVIVSSRVRLARNYQDLPFALSGEKAQLCVDRARQALDGADYRLYKLSDMPELERRELMEDHLISQDLLKRPETGAALIRSDRRVSVMINEEDHLRIQAIVPGFDLTQAAREAFET